MTESIKKLFSNRVVVIFTHVAIWVLYLLLPAFMRWRTPPMRFRGGSPPPPHMMDTPPSWENIVTVSILTNIALILFFYFNYYILIPKVLYRRKTGFYILTLLACVALHHYLAQFVKYLVMGSEARDMPLFASILPASFILAVSLALRVTSDRLREQRERQERETENLKSELSFLRSQISPHFLFNIMNNLVSLNRKKSELVEPTLIKLSQLMRYMLYESDDKKVNIENEISYLENYIDLQKLRFGNTLEVIFNKNIVETEWGEIEPMLLIPFVENAFKHGTGMVLNPFIKMDFEYKKGVLDFKIENKYDPLSTETKDADSGIGLKNVSRRLALLYGENHVLNIEPEGDIFKVHLNLKIA